MRRLAATGLGAIALATVLPAGVAHATDILCNVNQDTWVRNAPGGSVLYTVPAGGGFRIIGFNVDGTWAVGHGNGHSDGWAPNDGRFYNCH
jgi:hypothetical protein